jgi:hypothetical protein
MFFKFMSHLVLTSNLLIYLYLFFLSNHQMYIYVSIVILTENLGRHQEEILCEMGLDVKLFYLINYNQH